MPNLGPISALNRVNWPESNELQSPPRCENSCGKPKKFSLPYKPQKSRQNQATLPQCRKPFIYIDLQLLFPRAIPSHRQGVTFYSLLDLHRFGATACGSGYFARTSELVLSPVTNCDAAKNRALTRANAGTIVGI